MSKSKAERMEDVYNELAPDWRGIPTKGQSMSQPNEPRFEDDFDVDTDPPEQETPTIESIAITKAWNYTLEYDSNSGMVSPRAFSSELKEAYKAGFLEGFSHRFTTNDKVSE